MSELKKALSNWEFSLDAQIGDTEAEIQKRQARNKDIMAVRSDLKQLQQYIAEHPLPAPVERALLLCLRWNPFAKVD